MDKLGIQSLNAGAPDLRLTGDQRPTYTQRRRNQMAYGGIAGLDGRKAYGIGSFFQDVKDKFVDDIIPNEIKENPMLATLGGGALLNQFGMPDWVPGVGGMGENWLGDLLGAAIPGDTQFNTVLGDTLPFMYNETLSNNPAWGGIESLGSAEKAAQVLAQGRQFDLNDPIGYVKDLVTQKVNEAIGTGTTPTGGTPTGGTPTGGTTTGKQPYPINWKDPLKIGTAIGAADYLTRSEDKMPAQLSVNIPQSGQAAFDDPTLRFKPKAEYADLAEGGRIRYSTGGLGLPERPLSSLNRGADWKESPLTIPDNWLEIILKRLKNNLPSGEDIKRFIPEDVLEEMRAQGGRIGYQGGGVYEKALMDAWKTYQEQGGTLSLEKFAEEFMKGTSKAQGGRIGAQEGGLMDLGGMEKDYRQEGGFVPIGGKEKADDVPARLSKNEFVFTADAVRNAGGGDIDEGAAVMERLMENLEAGGKVSEDSQGLEGAQEMFANTQRLQNRII